MEVLLYFLLWLMFGRFVAPALEAVLAAWFEWPAVLDLSQRRAKGGAQAQAEFKWQTGIFRRVFRRAIPWPPQDTVARTALLALLWPVVSVRRGLLLRKWLQRWARKARHQR